MDVKYLKGTRLQYEAYIKAGKIKDLNFYYITGSEQNPNDDSRHLYLGLVEISNNSLIEEFENNKIILTELETLIYAVDKKVVNLKELVDSIVVNDIRPLENKLVEIEKELVGGIHYRGSVPTVDDLPANPKQGDLYEIEADGSEYCYNGEKWFVYGSAHFVPVETSTIAVNGKELSVKIAGGNNALTVTEDGLFVEESSLSEEDRELLDSIPENYATKEELEDAISNVKVSMSWEDLE